MRQYSPVNFADVRITGDFWRERLETVLTHTIPSQHGKLDEVGILASLKFEIAKACSAADDSAQRAWLHHADLLGF